MTGSAFNRTSRTLSTRLRLPMAALLAATSAAGCALLPPNSFLDPTAVGTFPIDYKEGGIRRVLTPLESPIGLANASEPTPEDLVPNYDDYRIGRQDIVAVAIDDYFSYGALNQQLEVSPSGYISLPLLGPVYIEGMTERQVEQELVRRVREAKLLPEPVVQVLAQVRRNKFYQVMGAVRLPGTYPITQADLRLLDAIGAAGDIGPSVKTVYVIRRESGPAAASRPGEHAIDGGAISASTSGGGTAEDDFDRTIFARPGMQSATAGAAPQTQGAGAPPPDSDMDDALRPGRTAFPQLEDAVPGFKPLVFDPATGELTEAPGEPKAQPPGPVAAPAGPLEPEPEGFGWDDVPRYEISQRVIEVDVRAVKSGDPRYNIVIRDRDIINVPVDTGVFYIMGEVNRPGVYAFNDREVTLKQAMALVGGFSALAWPQRVEIIRHEKGTDKQVTIPVNLDAIFAGLEDDVFLKDNDIVNVGTHTIAPFLFVIRNSFRFTYGFGFVYDRNFADQDAYSARLNPETERQLNRQSRGLPF